MPTWVERVSGSRWRKLLPIALCAAGLGALPGAGAADFTARTVSWRNADVTVDAKLYLPPGRGPHPAVLFVHGRRGWDDAAAAQVRRIIEHGFAVLAPDYHSPRFMREALMAGRMQATGSARD